MKYSRFNRLYEFDGKYYLYNSLSNSTSVINKSLFELLNYNNNEIISFNEVLPDTIYNQLIENKNLVESDDYEILKLRNRVERYRKTGETIYLTIAPTMDCNFDCYYCFEKSHESLIMTEETENNIIEYLRIIPDLKNIRVTWFGGEPLLAIDNIMRLTEKIKNLKLNYSASIVTNGYDLEKIHFYQFVDLKITSIQTTIDGPKEIHDKRRTHKICKNSFEKIIENLKLLSSQSNGNHNLLNINIRVNIDNENMHFFKELNEYLRNKINYSNLNITFGWIKYTSERKIESYCIKRPDIIEFNKLFKNMSDVNKYFYPSNFIQECFVRNFWSIVIAPNGDVYKCWEELGESKHKLGVIDNFSFLNSKRQLDYLYVSDQFLTKSCERCSILPICNACPKEFIDKTDFGKCPDIKFNFEEYLKMYLEKPNA